MIVKLLRDARINHSAGEIVEVSPEQGDFLLSVGSAEAVKKAEPKKEETKEEPIEEPKKKRVTKKK